MSRLRPFGFLLLTAWLFESAHAARPLPASESKTLHEQGTIEYVTYFYPPPNPGGPVPMYIGLAFHTGGTVDLQAHMLGGNSSGVIGITAQGLTPATYTVSAQTASSGSSIILGTMEVRARPTISTGSGASTTSGTPGGTVGHAKFGTAASPLPQGFNLFDVGAVVLTPQAVDPPAAAGSDVHTDVLFASGGINSTANLIPVPDGTGYLDSVPRGHYDALCPLTPGTGGPIYATGFALIRFSWSGIHSTQFINLGTAVTTGHLTIHAENLPPNTPVTYAADGVDLGSATTNAAGILNVFATQGSGGALPTHLDLLFTTAITVSDASGDVLAVANF